MSDARRHGAGASWPRRAAVALVVAFVSVAVWLVLRDGAPPHERAPRAESERQDGPATTPDALASAPLASAHETEPGAEDSIEAAARRAALTAPALPADGRTAGRVVVVERGEERPVHDDGRLELAVRALDGTTSVLDLAIVGGAFELPADLAPRLVVGARLAPAASADAPRAFGPDRDQPLRSDAGGFVVRLAGAVAFVLDVRDALTREPLPEATFADAESRPLVAQRDEDLHTLSVPAGCRRVLVAAPGHLELAIELPRLGSEQPRRVDLVPRGVLEVEVVGASSDAAFAVVAEPRGDARLVAPRRESFRGARCTLDDVPAAPLLATLVDESTGELVESVGVLFEAGRARAVFVPGRTREQRFGRLVVEAPRGAADPQRLRARLSNLAGAIDMGSIRIDNGSVSLDLAAAPDGTRFATEIDLLAGAFEVASDELGGARVRFEVHPGATTRVELRRPERVEVVLRAHEAASGAPLPFASLGWIGTGPDHHTTGSAPCDGFAPTVGFEVEVGRVVATASAMRDGVEYAGRVEFAAHAGRPVHLDVPLEPRPAQRWLRIAIPEDAAERGPFDALVLDPEGRVLAQTRRTRGAYVRSTFEIGVRTAASHVLVVPPDHGGAPRYASAWVELAAEGSALVEFAPLEH